MLFTRIISAHPGPVEESPPGVYTGATVVEAATREARGRWRAPTPIVPTGGESTSEPEIAADPANRGVIATWIRRPVGTYLGRAEVSTGDALGQWQQPASIAQNASAPSVVASRNGMAIAAWVDEPPGEFSEIQTADYAPR
jgi:hypothetical protein